MKSIADWNTKTNSERLVHVNKIMGTVVMPEISKMTITILIMSFEKEIEPIVII